MQQLHCLFAIVKLLVKFTCSLFIYSLDIGKQLTAIELYYS